MSAKSRNKGASGERELIRLIEDHLGIRLERNLAQSFAGGHDLIGLDDWAIEVKRYKEVGETEKRAFWVQAVEQANRVGKRPAVCFRADRKPWRVLVHAGTDLFDEIDYNATAEVSLDLFFGLIRESINEPESGEEGRSDETAKGAGVWTGRRW
jgi:hypothetical protein